MLLSHFSHVQLCDPIRRQPTRLPCPWDSPGKNTGVGCHFLLQCMEGKSKSEVTQSCPTLCDPIDSLLPGSSVPEILQAGVGCHFLLQCMKVKSESEVAQSCPTLSDLLDCSLPTTSVHEIFQARVLAWGAIVYIYTHTHTYIYFFKFSTEIYFKP